MNGLLYSSDPTFYFSPQGNIGSPLEVAQQSLYVTNVSRVTPVVVVQLYSCLSEEPHCGHRSGECRVMDLLRKGTQHYCIVDMAFVRCLE